MSGTRSRDLEAFLQGSVHENQSYTVEKTLKETEDECTELVRAADGSRWVRKLFCRDDPAIERSYRAIQKAGSPCLPLIRDVRRTSAGTEVIREYYTGPTLRAWVEEYGSLPEREARGLIVQLCRSVEALHSLEPPIVHRDINPSNVIVTLGGPRLIDFGIARAYDKGASRDTHAWGTTGYAAPEQFGFDQSDERTDVFALGMLFWFLLTGEDPKANLAARLRQGDAPSQMSREASKVIARCVALSPDERYANAEDLADALRDTDMAAPYEPQAGDSRGQHPVRKALSKIWLAASSVFMAFLALAIILTLAEPWRLSVPEGWAHALLFCIGLAVMFVPAWLLTNDLFSMRSRPAFLREHTLVRCASIIAASFLIGAFLAGISTTGLPADYLQLAQQHGSTI